MRTEPAIRRNDRLEAPEAPTGAPTPRTRTLVVALIVVSALFVAAAGVAVWRSTEIGNRDDEITTLEADRDLALTEASAAADRADALASRVDRLEARLTATVGDEEALAAKLANTRATLDRMLGPALADGRHFAFVVAVGAAQEPPRLVIDVAQWFTDRAAADAAIEDGVLPPGSTSIENGFYIRNEDPRWRVVQVAPGTTVDLVVYPFGDLENPRAVSLMRFQELFRLDQHSAIRGFPYWVTVEGGTIVAIEQQFIP